MQPILVLESGHQTSIELKPWTAFLNRGLKIAMKDILVNLNRISLVASSCEEFHFSYTHLYSTRMGVGCYHPALKSFEGERLVYSTLKPIPANYKKTN